MRTPETPDTPVARKNSPTHSIRSRVFTVSAATLSLMLSSMHQPDNTSPVVDTRISLASGSTSDESELTHDMLARKVRPTAEQVAQLDEEIDACLAMLSLETMATIGMFKFSHPNPEAKDMKTLLDSMPAGMRPRIIRIAKLVALHPEESERVQQRVCDTVGLSFDMTKRPSCGDKNKDVEHAKAERSFRLMHVRSEANAFLKECDECELAFAKELREIVYAEALLHTDTQQVAQIGK